MKRKKASASIVAIYQQNMARLAEAREKGDDAAIQAYTHIVRSMEERYKLGRHR